MSVLDKVKKLSGKWIGDGQNPPIKTAELIAALETPDNLSEFQKAELSRAVVSLECVMVWVQNNCTRGPEAEEIRLVLERLEKAFPGVH